MKRLFALLLSLSVLLAPVVSDARGGGGGRSGVSSSGKSSSTGSVSVKGYTRKDGTYVAPYTRSKPGEGDSFSSSQSSSGSGLTSHRAPSSYHLPSAYYLASAPGARDGDGRLVRNEAAKREFLRQTDYPHGRPGYVVDHIVPLKRGGCDCPSNMQWQTVAEAKAKDKWE
jgi:hypothetical protein